MNKPWPMVPLGEVLTPVYRQVDVVPIKNYQFAGTYSFGRGIFVGQIKDGSSIRSQRLFEIHADDFVYCKIMAWEGAFGLVPITAHKCVVSQAFCSFEINQVRLLPSFLSYYFRQEFVWKRIGAKSTGTNVRRRSLHPNTFLKAEIPLPPLSEQKRITARLEELSTKIEEARGLRREAVEEAEALIDTFYSEAFQKPHLGSYISTLNKADLHINKESRDPRKYYSKEFSYVDISTVGKGPSLLNKSKMLPIADAPSRARRVIRTGDIIFSTVRPNLRAIAKIGQELDNQICSTGFAVFSPGPTLDPDFLHYQLCSPFFINQCIAKTTGGHYPAINDTNLHEVLFVVPPLSEQRRIVAYLDGLQAKVDALKRLQSETATELNAMLPSVLDMAFKGGRSTIDSLYKKLQPIEIHQPRETTLEHSAKISVAELAPMAYPATDADKTICAVALAVVEQSGGLSSMDHLDALLLATHPDWCKKFLDRKDRYALGIAMRSAPKNLFVGQDQSIRWKECRDYLEELGAITVAHGANDQSVCAGTSMTTTKAGLTTGADEVVRYALAALNRIRDLRKDSTSAPQAQRSILDALAEEHRQYQLAA